MSCIIIHLNLLLVSFFFLNKLHFFYQTQVQMLKKKLLDFPTANADLLTGAVKTEMVCSLNNSNP